MTLVANSQSAVRKWLTWDWILSRQTNDEKAWKTLHGMLRIGMRSKRADVTDRLHSKSTNEYHDYLSR